MASGFVVNAPAKINLSLHIEGRRADGYHELNGLVVFSDFADQLHFNGVDKAENSSEPSPEWSLDVVGPFADLLRDTHQSVRENLVLKAVRLFGEQNDICCGGLIRLNKKLPIAAGVGGGSSDAAATLNALQQLSPHPLNHHHLLRIALELGADVPMCLTPTAQMVGGIGEVCQPVDDFESLPAVLVNPGVPVETGAVFRELGASYLPEDYQRSELVLPSPHTPMAVIDWLQKQRNDLQGPSVRVAPIIADVLDALAQGHLCRLARMSGSGATCFGLYHHEGDALEAARVIKREHPDWWVQSTLLS